VFLILVYFLSQINYVACYSSSFYQVLGRPNDLKKVELASLPLLHEAMGVASVPALLARPGGAGRGGMTRGLAWTVVHGGSGGSMLGCTRGAESRPEAWRAAGPALAVRSVASKRRAKGLHLAGFAAQRGGDWIAAVAKGLWLGAAGPGLGLWGSDGGGVL